MAVKIESFNLFDTEHGSAVIPNQWLTYIIRPTGKPDFKAIMVLQYLVAVHRPYYDEDGQAHARFDGELYFTTTRQIAERFNLTYYQARSALGNLVDLGLISTASVARTINIEGSPYRLNGLEITLNYENIERITNTKPLAVSEKGAEENPQNNDAEANFDDNSASKTEPSTKQPKPLAVFEKRAEENPKNHSSLNTDSCYDDMNDMHDSHVHTHEKNSCSNTNTPKNGDVATQPKPPERTRTEIELDTDKIGLLKQIGVDDSRVIPEILAMPHATVAYLQRWASAELPAWVERPVGFIIHNIRQGVEPKPEWLAETETSGEKVEVDERVLVLHELGITATKMINRLLQLPHVTLEYLQQWQTFTLPEWVTSPIGFIISQIFKGQQPENFLPAKTTSADDKPVDRAPDTATDPETKPPIFEKPRPTIDPLKKQWTSVLEILKHAFAPPAFRQMLAQSAAMSLVDDCLTVLIPCPRALEFLQYRAMRHLERAVQDVFGETVQLQLTTG